jgi:hypothetical protein
MSPLQKYAAAQARALRKRADAWEREPLKTALVFVGIPLVLRTANAYVAQRNQRERAEKLKDLQRKIDSLSRTQRTARADAVDRLRTALREGDIRSKDAQDSLRYALETIRASRTGGATEEEALAATDAAIKEVGKVVGPSPLLKAIQEDDRPHPLLRQDPSNHGIPTFAEMFEQNVTKKVEPDDHIPAHLRERARQAEAARRSREAEAARRRSFPIIKNPPEGAS